MRRVLCLFVVAGVVGCGGKKSSSGFDDLRGTWEATDGKETSDSNLRLVIENDGKGRFVLKAPATKGFVEEYQPLLLDGVRDPAAFEELKKQARQLVVTIVITVPFELAKTDGGLLDVKFGPADGDAVISDGFLKYYESAKGDEAVAQLRDVAKTFATVRAEALAPTLKAQLSRAQYKVTKDELRLWNPERDTEATVPPYKKVE